MKRYLLFAILASLSVSPLGFAEVNHQVWMDGAGGSVQTMIDFHADKLPGMDVTPDIDETLPDSYYDGNYHADLGDNYTSNIWGWVTVPVSGTYTWHICSDDHGALYVADSMDEIAANYGGGLGTNPNLMCQVDGWANFEDWNGADAGGNQTSDPVQYTAGQTLALYATMREGTGGDNLAVGWTMPGAGEITYLGENITNIPPVPTIAKPVAPGVEATDVPRDAAVLEWGPGKFANTHNVYFSDNMDDVVNGVALAAEGLPLATTTYNPGRLAFDTTYYWRVDEVNSAPDFTVFAGDVWSFTVEPLALTATGASVAASSAHSNSEPERTLDGSGLTDGVHDTDLTAMWLTAADDVADRSIQYDLGKVHKLHQIKVWNHNTQTEAFLGYGIKEARVETSLDGETWTELKILEIPQAPGIPYAGSSLNLDGVVAQYVKLTALSNYSLLGLAQVGLSEVRFATIPVQAREPQPADDSVTRDVDVVLGWRAGREVAHSEVVFSTDEQAVIDGSAVVGTVEGTSFDPGALDMATAYFWKVNEVNEAEAPSVYEGDLWTFNTPEDLVIDDMESYMAEEGSFIWEYWIDGFENPGDNGAVVGNDGDDPETTIVHEGNKSLPMAFDNTTAPISEATRYFDAALDLTQGNAESLKLQVRGDAPSLIDNGETLTIGASGVDIWGTVDEFRYVYKPLTGDGSIIARVDSMLQADPWTKAGVMIRESLTASSMYAYVCSSSENGTRYQYRLTEFGDAEANDALMDGIQQTLPAAPVWVKVERVGNNFNGYYSTDENAGNWTPMGDNPLAISMLPSAYIGLAVTSHNVNASTVAVFSNVSTTGATGGCQEISFGTAHPDNDPAPMYVRLVDTAGKEQVFDHPNAQATVMMAWDEWILPLGDLTINAAQLDSITVGVSGAGVQGKVFVDYIRTFKAYPAD